MKNKEAAWQIEVVVRKGNESGDAGQPAFHNWTLPCAGFTGGRSLTIYSGEA